MQFSTRGGVRDGERGIRHQIAAIVCASDSYQLEFCSDGSHILAEIDEPLRRSHFAGVNALLE
jgi:hypothetical protein